MCVYTQGSPTSTSPQSTIHRNVNQQQRIHDGLKDGSLTSREAARLEREQGAIAKMQAEFLEDGTLSASEQASLDKAQDRASRNIHNARHNGATADPTSESSQRAQASVQRNINQQRRIENGIEDGSLTNTEVANLQQGQARLNQRQFQAMRDGNMSANEFGRIDCDQDCESELIYEQKHDAQTRESEQDDLLAMLLLLLKSLFGDSTPTRPMPL
jgi:hypothetical protein